MKYIEGKAKPIPIKKTGNADLGKLAFQRTAIIDQKRAAIRSQWTC